MADDLRLIAGVEDQFTGPLARLKKGLHDVTAETKAGAGAMRKDWEGIRGEVSKFQGALQGVQPVLSAVGLTGFGAVLSFGGIAAAVRSFSSETRNLSLLSRDIGLTVDQLRTFNSLGEKFGVTAETMKGAAKNLSSQMFDIKRHGETYTQLQAMNLSKLAEQLASAPDIQTAIERGMEGLRNIPDAEVRRRVSRMLFGTDDIGLIASNLHEPVKDAMKKLSQAVGQMDKETEQAAQKFEERMAKFGHVAERAKLKYIGPLLKGMTDIFDQQDEAETDPKGVLLKNLTKERDELKKLIDKSPDWQKWPLQEQLGGIDNQIKEADPDGSVRRRLQEGKAVPQAGPGSVANDQRLAELDAKRKDAQERLDWNEANKSQVDPALLPGRQRELSEEIKKLTEEMRRLREGGGATAQQSSFGGVGMGGGAMIQRASFGGMGPFGGGGGYGGGMGSGNGSGSYGGVRRGTGPLGAGDGVLSGSSAGNLTKLIDEEAKKAGVDPRIMHGIRAGESLHTNRYDVKDDALESSWGPFQLNRRRGLGVQFEKENPGLDLRDPKTIAAQVRWVARFLAKGGSLGNWMGYHGPRDANPRWGDSGYAPDGGKTTTDHEGIPLKSKEAVAGGPHAEGLGSLMKGLGAVLPGGLKSVSALNDAFHHRANPGSMHTKGLAADVTLNDPRFSSVSADAIRRHLRASGLTDRDFKVMDEYRNPSGHATGGHLHVQFNNQRAAAAYQERIAAAREAVEAGKLAKGPLWRPADQDDRAAQKAPDEYAQFRAWKESEARAGRTGDEDDNDAAAFKRWKTRKAPASPLPPRRPAGQALLERVLPGGGRGRDGADGVSGGKGTLHVKFEGAPKGTRVTPSLAGLFRETKVSHVPSQMDVA